MLLRSTLLAAAALVLPALPAADATQTPVPNPWPGMSVTCASRGLAGTPYVAGVNCRHLIQNGYPRRYVVWVPPSAVTAMNAGEPVPLVTMLHGSSGTGEQFLKMSGWRQKASAEGFVAAFPTGLEYLVTERPGHPRHSTKWNSFNLIGIIDPNDRPRGYPAAPAPFPADDVGFLRALAADVRDGLRIDERRVYIAGFSNGGEMCARLAIEASDLVAAAACNAGGLDGIHPTPAGGRHVPALFTIGADDDRIIARMQAVDPFVTELPLDPAAMLANPVLSGFVRDQLASFGLSDASPAVYQTRIETELEWTTPLPVNGDGNPLLFAVLDGVRHQYPNGGNNLPNGFVMADRAWTFFESHPQP
jgi:polyhydroxybutyrate depolymerase